MRVSRKEFSSALSAAAGVIDKKSLPILTCALLKPVADAVEITATDLEVTIVLRIPAAIGPNDHAVAVPVAQFRSVVKSLPKHVAEIELTSGQLEIAVNGIRVCCMEAKDFPEPKDTADQPRPFLVSNLLAALRAVAPAMSSDKSRYALNGAYLNVEHRHLVATDGHRLHRHKLHLAEPAGDNNGAILIPRKAVELVVSSPVAGLITDPAAITIHEGTVTFSLENGGRVIAKQAEGTFPDYRQLIADCRKSQVVASLRADRNTLIDAITTARAVAQKERRCPIVIMLDQDVKIHAHIPDTGTADVPVQGATYTGSRLAVEFNADYLLDVLTQLSHSLLSVKFAGSEAPAVFRDDDFLGLVMPMRKTSYRLPEEEPTPDALDEPAKELPPPAEVLAPPIPIEV